MRALLCAPSVMMPLLRAGEADRVDARAWSAIPRSAIENPLSRSQEHVQLAPVRVLGDLAGERQQLVRGVAMAETTTTPGDRLRALRHPRGHPPDLLHVGDGGAAVFPAR